MSEVTLSDEFDGRLIIGGFLFTAISISLLILGPHHLRLIDHGFFELGEDID